MVLDFSVHRHTYVEDCEVCCQPWQVIVTYDGEGAADVSVTALDGTD